MTITSFESQVPEECWCWGDDLSAQRWFRWVWHCPGLPEEVPKSPRGLHCTHRDRTGQERRDLVPRQEEQSIRKLLQGIIRSLKTKWRRVLWTKKHKSLRCSLPRFSSPPAPLMSLVEPGAAQRAPGTLPSTEDTSSALSSGISRPSSGWTERNLSSS